MKKDTKDMEQKLLNDDFDAYMKNQIEKEIAQEIKGSKGESKKVIIEDFEDVPKEHIFSLNSTFYLFNRTTKQECYLNGIQAESLIGMRKDIREKVLNKEIESFIVDDYYVKFASFEG